MKNLCERSLYRPGSDSFLSAERFRIDPACIMLSSGFYENMK